jgi:hypothetical protein
VANPTFTDEEDALIADPSNRPRQLAIRLGRNVRAISSRRDWLRHAHKRRAANAANIRAYYARGWTGPVHRWTPDEDEAILDPDRPTDDVLSHQVRHTIDAIHRRRRKLLESGW